MTMFGDGAFTSWPHIVVGAICFALLFELPLVLADYLTEGSVGLSRTTLCIGAAAFLGYVVVGGWIKRFAAPPGGS